VENERNREINARRGLTDKIEVVDGSFESLPYEDGSIDVVWSQDAFLHSGNRTRVLEEIARVLKPGGQLIFTDPMAADGCSTAVLQPILDRIHLDTMGSPGFYRRELARLGFSAASSDGFEEHREQLARHYGRVLEETERQEADGLADKVSSEYLTQMKKGLGHWVDGGNERQLTWGIFHFRR
jgi:glycine/sarcosine/dimethylglycine N-methyltransferase